MSCAHPQTMKTSRPCPSLARPGGKGTQSHYGAVTFKPQRQGRCPWLMKCRPYRADGKQLGVEDEQPQRGGQVLAWGSPGRRSATAPGGVDVRAAWRQTQSRLRGESLLSHQG
jgi:hypothetical protein